MRATSDVLRRCAVLVISLIFILTGSLRALDPDLSTAQYLHTSWTQEEGNALPAVTSIAQTTDGYLWLATVTGLIRFDGMRFIHWESPQGQKLPDTDIRYLKASADGGLWVGTLRSIFRLKRGHLVTYPDADRWLGGRNRTITEDHLGRLWLIRASESPELGALLPSGAFRVYSARDGLPADSIHTVFEDKDANLWIVTSHELCRWSPGNAARCTTFRDVSILSVAGETPSDLLFADAVSASVLRFSEGKLRAIARGTEKVPLIPKCLLRDRNGNIWIGTAGQGLTRIGNGTQQRFTRANGLSSDYIRALLEDREHNLWVATARGLDRFRDPQVLRVSTPEGLSSDVVTSVFASRDGSVWVGTALGGLNRISRDGIKHYSMSSGLPSSTVTALLEDPAGRLWMGTTAGFGYLWNGRYHEVLTRDHVPLHMVFAIAADTEQKIWVADQQGGLFRVRNEAAEPVSIPGVQTNDVYQLYFDRSGVLWIGYFHGGLAALNGTSVRRFTDRDGVPSGPVQALAQDQSGTMWIGTRDGFARYCNGVWTSWGKRHGVPEGGVWGISDDRYGALWLMTSQGLSRLTLRTLDQSPGGLPAKLEFKPHGQSDGVRLAAAPAMANPRSTRSRDGRLWICTDDGVAIVDPSRIRSNPLAPPVVIEEVAVDGRQLDINSASEIKFRGRQMHLTYTGLSLTVPEGIRFRYRLEGLDRDWTDAGTRRSVDYVNLSPGHYRFQVIASNSDGVWNMAGATLAFRIPPYFYQTTWFLALIVAVPATIAWAAHRMRMQMLAERYELIAQERTRLTRELHDSLLQGFVGVVYQLEAAARLFDTAAFERGRHRLERAIELADRALQEARQTMVNMRVAALESSTLPEALSATASRLTEGTHIAFHLDVKGRVRQLPYDAQANVYLIGREAITNSVNHARAKRIEAGLTYSAKQVRLAIEDDGEGFDLKDATAKQDHWGIAGMRERANQIGATFSVFSSPGQGTRVEVVVPCND